MPCDIPLALVFATSLNFRSFCKIKNLSNLVSKYTSVPKLINLIKQLFHSRLLDMRLVIANSTLLASLAIYHRISNARSWLILKYSFEALSTLIHFKTKTELFCSVSKQICVHTYCFRQSTLLFVSCKYGSWRLSLTTVEQ